MFPSQTRLGRGFWRAVGEVVKSNAAMDFLSSTRSDPVYHFDSERVDSAIVMLRQFWAQTLLSARAKEYQSARHSLGQLFHSLQVHSGTATKTRTTKDHFDTTDNKTKESTSEDFALEKKCYIPTNGGDANSTLKLCNINK